MGMSFACSGNAHLTITRAVTSTARDPLAAAADLGMDS